MFKDNPERRSYRKSPGRQYEYEHNPLQGQRSTEPSPHSEPWNSQSGARKPSRPGGVLAPRPDPRRTRQLMRQNILASKAQDVLDESVPAERYEPVTEGSRQRYLVRRDSSSLRAYGPQHEEDEEEEIVEDWLKHGEVLDDEPDFSEEGEEDPLDERVRALQPRVDERRSRKLDEELLEEELEEKRKKATRRKFLIGAVAIGGAGIAAYELIPRVPQAIGNGAANMEQQLQKAFNDGVAKGAEDAKKELLKALGDIEGFSLDAAIEAAKLTRVAYDVFVNPLVTLAADVAGEFLTVTWQSLITGRKWLVEINEDSPTLASLQTVLKTWVDQANEMPKQIQTITETELDGAQSYLRSLQQTIKDEQAKLDAQGTPTPKPQGTPAPKK